jgi:hypothetical protein
MGGLALFITLGGVGYAATGGNFILGQANTATTPSSLAAPIAGGKALQLTNTSATGGSTALGLTVGAGKSPFTVNSSGKVTNLNADRLDSLDSTTFLRTTGKAADSDKLDGFDSSAFGVKIVGGLNEPSDEFCTTANVWSECSKISVTVPAGKTYYAVIFSNGSLYEFGGPENRVLFCASARLSSGPIGANCNGNDHGLLLKADDLVQASAVDIRTLSAGTWILSTGINSSDQLDFRNGFDKAWVQTKAIIIDGAAPAPVAVVASLGAQATQ